MSIATARSPWLVEVNYDDVEFLSGVVPSLDKLASWVEERTSTRPIKGIYIRPIKGSWSEALSDE